MTISPKSPPLIFCFIIPRNPGPFQMLLWRPSLQTTPHSTCECTWCNRCQLTGCWETEMPGERAVSLWKYGKKCREPRMVERVLCVHQPIPFSSRPRFNILYPLHISKTGDWYLMKETWIGILHTISRPGHTTSCINVTLSSPWLLVSQDGRRLGTWVTWRNVTQPPLFWSLVLDKNQRKRNQCNFIMCCHWWICVYSYCIVLYMLSGTHGYTAQSDQIS